MPPRFTEYSLLQHTPEYTPIPARYAVVIFAPPLKDTVIDKEGILNGYIIPRSRDEGAGIGSRPVAAAAIHIIFGPGRYVQMGPAVGAAEAPAGAEGHR